jgi:hypothetical protein
MQQVRCDRYNRSTSSTKRIKANPAAINQEDAYRRFLALAAEEYRFTIDWMVVLCCSSCDACKKGAMLNKKLLAVEGDETLQLVQCVSNEPRGKFVEQRWAGSPQNQTADRRTYSDEQASARQVARQRQ